jgi:hypothetical protein
MYFGKIDGYINPRHTKLDVIFSIKITHNMSRLINDLKMITGSMPNEFTWIETG